MVGGEGSRHNELKRLANLIVLILKRFYESGSYAIETLGKIVNLKDSNREIK